jgi:hypothetical protein
MLTEVVSDVFVMLFSNTIELLVLKIKNEIMKTSKAAAEGDFFDG